MTMDDFEAYWKCIEPIEAREMLSNITVSSYPKMSKKDRAKVKNKLQENSQLKLKEQEENYMSAEDSARQIMMVIANG